MLPLVSKRWARIMRTSTEVWADACLDLTEIMRHDSRGQRLTVDSTAMALWFHARPGRVKHLGLRCWQLHRGLQLPSEVTSMMLSTQAASIERLSINVSAYEFRGSEFGVIAAFKRLEYLHVHVEESGFFDRGAGVLLTACCLPALCFLDISHTEEAGGTVVPRHHRGGSLPRCREIARLRSASLTQLSLVIASGEDDVLDLTGVPSLLQCHLLADCDRHGETVVHSTSFEACTSLTKLTLQHLRNVMLHDGCFDSLSALTWLTLADCDFEELPQAIGSLTSLEVLNLNGNDDLGVTEAGLSVLRALKELQVLDMAKSSNARHDDYTLQALFDLVQGLRDQGRRLHVNFDSTLSQTFQPHMGYWGSIS